MAISKTLVEQFHELEDHLILLTDNLWHIQNGTPAYLRQAATELRNLVCLSSSTEGLLWRLCDATGVLDTVTLCKLSSAQETMPQEITKGMTFAYSPLRTPSPLWRDIQAINYSLRNLVKKEQSVFVSGKACTFEQVIKLVAEKIGTAHSSNEIPPHLAELAATSISDVQLFFPILESIGLLVLHIGYQVLMYAKSNFNFQLSAKLGYSRQPPTLPPAPILNGRLVVPEESQINPLEGSISFVIKSQAVPNIFAFPMLRMPRVRQGAITVDTITGPTTNLFVSVTGLFLSPVHFSSMLSLMSGEFVHITLTWKSPEICFYLNGRFVDHRKVNSQI